MPRNEVYSKYEDARSALFLDRGRFIDMGLQFRVYAERKSGKAVPGDLYPSIYGGVYDRLHCRYVAPPENIRELPITKAQIPFVLEDPEGVTRQMLLGTMGAGKTFGLVLRFIRRALERPNSTWGLVGATNDRRLILWNQIINWIKPFGWLDGDPRVVAKEIRLFNGTIAEVVAATAPSKQAGSPIQGRSWTEAMCDEAQSITAESHREIDSRGRRAGSKYIVSCSATNQRHIPSFRVDLERYKKHDNHRLFRVTGFQNPFVDPNFFEGLKTRMSDRDYRALVLCEDLPSETLAYHSFDYQRHVIPIPEHLKDVTKHVTRKFLGKARDVLIGQDFGVLVDASIAIKIYADDYEPDDYYAFCVGEVTSYKTITQKHARKLLGFYPASQMIVSGDPHLNTSDVQKSDYAAFRREGIDIIRAKEGNIHVEERIDMTNRLFENASGESRLFIEADANGEPKCRKLVESYLTVERDENTGKVQPRKDIQNDMTHWPAAVEYGLYRIFRTRARKGAQFKTLQFS